MDKWKLLICLKVNTIEKIPMKTSRKEEEEEWQGIKRAAGKLRASSDSSRKPCDVQA